MNKQEIKQIILEEIEAVLKEQTEDERIAQAMETGDEEELEDLAAGALDRAEQEVVDTLTKDYEGDIDDEDIAAMQKDFRDESDAIFGKPSFVEENRNRAAEEVIQDFAVDIRGAIKKGDKNTENKLKQQLKRELEMMDYNWKQDPDALELLGDFIKEDLDEMARTSNVFKLKDNHTYDEVLRFMQRVNNVLKTYKTPGQKRPKKRFSAEDMKKVATAITSSSGFTSKDIRLAVDAYNSPAQANKFIKALEMKGYIELISQLKKAMKPERDPNAPETRGRKAKSAEFDMSDDPMADLDALGLGGDIDLSDPLAENTNTMSELEKYIKQVIKEAKNPLAKKMKEIENQGRRAALETKLAAVDEMIEETQARLTRIDEDTEFREMMDNNAVKGVRKQLKELEKVKARLQKEYGKMKKMALPKNYDKGNVMDEEAPVAEDAIENAVDEVELEEDNFKLNESIKRMQKLANLKG